MTSGVSDEERKGIGKEGSKNERNSNGVDVEPQEFIKNA
jgi:hypothetical protein